MEVGEQENRYGRADDSKRRLWRRGLRRSALYLHLPAATLHRGQRRRIELMKQAKWPLLVSETSHRQSEHTHTVAILESKWCVYSIRRMVRVVTEDASRSSVVSA